MIRHYQPIPQVHTALDSHLISKNDIMLDEYMTVDVAIISDSRSRQNDCKLPHLRLGPDLVCVNLSVE